MAYSTTETLEEALQDNATGYGISSRFRPTQPKNQSTETPKGPSQQWGDAVVRLLMLGILVPLFSWIGAGPAMLALGVIHNDITDHCPALGFWATFLILWGAPTLVGLLRPLHLSSST